MDWGNWFAEQHLHAGHPDEFIYRRHQFAIHERHGRQQRQSLCVGTGRDRHGCGRLRGHGQHVVAVVRGDGDLPGGANRAAAEFVRFCRNELYAGGRNRLHDHQPQAAHRDRLDGAEQVLRRRHQRNLERHGGAANAGSAGQRHDGGWQAVRRRRRFRGGHSARRVRGPGHRQRQTGQRERAFAHRRAGDQLFPHATDVEREHCAGTCGPTGVWRATHRRHGDRRHRARRDGSHSGSVRQSDHQLDERDSEHRQ